jgi:hypothetical protein
MERTVNTSTGSGGGDMIRKKIRGSQPSNCPLTLFGGTGGPEAYRHLPWEPTYPKLSWGYQSVERGPLRLPPDSFSPPPPSLSPRPLQSLSLSLRHCPIAGKPARQYGQLGTQQPETLDRRCFGRKTSHIYLLSQVYQIPFKVLGPSAARIATREDLTNGATHGSSGEAIPAQVFMQVIASSVVCRASQADCTR